MGWCVGVCVWGWGGGGVWGGCGVGVDGGVGGGGWVCVGACVCVCLRGGVCVWMGWGCVGVSVGVCVYVCDFFYVTVIELFSKQVCMILYLHAVAEFRSFVMNNKAFGNVFCNSQKSFHTSPGSSDSNNRGYRLFFKNSTMAFALTKNPRISLICLIITD